MRLIDVRKSDVDTGRIVLTDKRTIQRESGNDIVKYAILSHRWQAEEVTLADVLQGTAASRQGFAKLSAAIRQTVKAGFDTLWCDTCCIDKSSSAELSEAINSMWDWYQDSAICFAYLYDVYQSDGWDRDEFGRSEWFTRGWCLQELLAPRSIDFFSANWKSIGSKEGLAFAISKTTKIPESVLLGYVPISRMSIAKRMSWAASRQTERIEDIAYCLMGLFSVNMPLLYGEGRKAFIRLQEEIMRSTDDMTLFVWRKPMEETFRTDRHGLLADGPSDFADTGASAPCLEWQEAAPFGMTNKGLSIQLDLVREGPAHSAKNERLAILPCTPPSQDAGFACIRVRKINEVVNGYVRTDLAYIGKIVGEGQRQAMYFPQNASGHGSKVLPELECALRLVALPPASFTAIKSMCIQEVSFDETGFWIEALNSSGSSPLLYLPYRKHGAHRVILFKHAWRGTKGINLFSLALGLMSDGLLGFDVSSYSRSGPIISDRPSEQRRLESKLAQWEWVCREANWQLARAGETKSVVFDSSSDSTATTEISVCVRARDTYLSDTSRERPWHEFDIHVVEKPPEYAPADDAKTSLHSGRTSKWRTKFK